MFTKLIVAALCILSTEAIAIKNKSSIEIEAKYYLSPQQLIATRPACQIWEALDVNKDGQLTEGELAQVINRYLLSLGVHPLQEDLNKFLALFHLSDADGSGVVSEGEAMNFLNSYKNKNQ